MSLKIFLDTETTGLIGPTASEVITAYFALVEGTKIVDSYELKARPFKWEANAEKIHGIPAVEAMDFPTKEKAVNDFYKWCPKNLDCYMWVNTSQGYFFDMAVLRLMFLDCQKLYDFYKLFNWRKYFSVLDLVKQKVLKGEYPLQGNTKGRMSFSQPNVYQSLFGCEYQAHDAKEDVLAMIKIYNHILGQNQWSMHH